ncbi:MAG: putative DNA binding domain-containing protein, partial [Bacteroidota bacterium]|nr:putative DNA binding domain-containing protein [Bacteroidota bacterium]
YVMDGKELLKVIEKGESERVEFKKSTAQMERALKAMCSFLNHKGGAVYFGVSDNGDIVGQDVSDSTLKSISQKVRQKIKPEVCPRINVLEAGGKKVVEVAVAKGTNKPYYLDGIAYNRAGSESPVIAPEEVNKKLLKKTGKGPETYYVLARFGEIWRDKGKRKYL